MFKFFSITNHYLIIITLLLLLSGCTSKFKYLSNKKQLNLSHYLLFESEEAGHFENNGKICFSPDLVLRETLFPGEVYEIGEMRNPKEVSLILSGIGEFDQAEYDHLRHIELSILLDDYSLDTFQLAIPDRLKNRYSYYNESMDIMNDTTTYWFLSPLLPTKKKHVYIRQDCGYFTLRDRDIEMRFQIRRFIKYFLKGKKIKKIGTIEFHLYTI